MVKRKSVRHVQLGLGVLASATLVLTGCAPGGSDNDSQEGGTAIVALTQEPGVFNPMFSLQTGSVRISNAFVVEPLFQILADGSYEAFLAEEIPTFENGGISEDGLTITFKLREGITWSDGEPLTAEDLAFTVEVAQNPEGAAQPTPEYHAIDSTSVVDELTLEVTLTQPTPSFLQLFQQVMPEHAFDSSAINLEDAGADLALGTGPFVFSKWEAGSKVVLDKNENYWLDPSLPKLDSVIVSIVPDTQAAIGGFINGDYDSLAFFTSGDMAQVAKAEEDGAPIRVYQPEQVGPVEWLWLNQSDNGDITTPHPVIGDIAIRQAMDAAIDRQSIIDDVLAGFGKLSGSFLYAGFGEVRTDPTAFDPDRARKILDAARWVEGDDGVRVKDGVRASLRFQTIAGDQVRSLYQQIIQQNLADIGIETTIDNVPSNSLFDSRDEGGLLANGDFDVVMTRDGFFSDPAIWVNVFDTGHIPVPGQTGISYAHWSNPEYDALAKKAATTMDSEERIAILKEIDKMFTSQILAIPLYASGVYYPFSTGIENVTVDHWNGPWTTQSSANWALSN